jgi:hypothetical protein
METITIGWKIKSSRFLARFIKITFGILLLFTMVVYGKYFFTVRLFALFPISDVGGIVINAPEIIGTNFAFSASSSQTDLKASWPTARLTSDFLQFPNGLTISKTLDFSATPLASYGITKVLLQYQINSSDLATSASLQISGIQSNEANFTTGYDSNGTPVINTPDGSQPLDTVSSISVSKLTNVSLNVHSFTLNGFNWNQATLQIIPLDSNGNQVTAPNGSFSYDAIYENQQIAP